VINMLRLSLVASAGSSVPIRAFCLPQLEQTALFFAAWTMRARRSGRAALRASAGNVMRAIKASLSRAPPPQRRAQLQRETTPTAGRGLRAAIHA